MKNTLFLLLLFCSTVTTYSQSSADKIIGTWWSEDKAGRTRIYKSNNKYYGKIVWLDEPNDDKGNPIKDAENPESSLRQRPILNLVILTGLEYDPKTNEWINGEVYDPDSGKTYTCTLWMENNKLQLRGYWGWFYETEAWTRYK